MKKKRAVFGPALKPAPLLFDPRTRSYRRSGLRFKFAVVLLCLLAAGACFMFIGILGGGRP